MKNSERIVILLSLFLGVVSLPLGGCEKKLTRENYEKIEVGMTVDQVTALLGPGEKMTEGGASKLAADMMGDITFAQQRQNQNQIKQGLGDLTGKAQNRDEQMQREAEGGVPPAQREHASARQAPSSTGRMVSVPAAPAAPSTRPPVRTRWIWKTDGVEVTVDFSDDIVTTKNQDGL
ncbi:MAG: hypothetical protein KF805_11925 [Phycisphaeraceae bacterium]|nr:hypothetical protein [Phycisphaeraceae bacterium]